MAKLNINEIALEGHVSSLHVMQVLYGKSNTLDADEVTRILAVVRKRGLEDQFFALTNRSNKIGVFATGEFGMDFVGHVARAVSEMANQHGYAIEYNFRRKDNTLQPNDFLDLIGNKGVILIASADAKDIIETCKKHNCPYVLVETEYRENNHIGVEITTNNRQAVEDAVHYLVGLRHRKFAYVTGELHNRSMRERLESYHMTLQAAGLLYDPNLVIETNWTNPDAYEKSKALFAREGIPTAVLCGNDIIALGVMRAAQENNLQIGSQVSIMGFDDIEIASEVSPALTTMRQPMQQMGELAFAHLNSMMQGETPEVNCLQLAAEMIIREFTGSAPR